MDVTMSDEQTTGTAKDAPQTVAELLELIGRERERLERAVAGMSDDALIAASGGWSAKDHLAHVDAWERRLIGEIHGDNNSARFGLDQATYDSTNIDVVNDMLLDRHRDDTPASVRAEFRAAGEALRIALAELSDADLVREVRHSDTEAETFLDTIAGDTFRHYPEHIAVIVD